jgi:gluconate 2-dehydrogenase gamma chain
MENETEPTERRRFSRTGFIGRAGAAALTLGLVACGEHPAQRAQPTPDYVAKDFPPLPPAKAPLCTVRSFFTTHEEATVDAFSSRLIPGSPEDPGAKEGCVTTYIDSKLAQFQDFATPTYFHPPFAKPLKKGAPPPNQVSKKTLLVASGELYRYGFQGSQTPQQAYRAGIEQLDAYTKNRFGLVFADLDDTRQDDVIGLLSDSNPENPPSKRDSPAAKKIQSFFEKPSAYGFFAMVQNDTNEGMFADPMYGGNRDFAGWKLVGYPGAQRAWTPRELRNGPTKGRRVQGLRQLMPEMQGEPAPGAILPIAHAKEN